ncbi:MAG: hypothetical protein PVF45_13160, partial [Anaerolineae bacterium]
HVGTHNDNDGGQVWKSLDGRTWTQVGLDGLVGDADNVGMRALAVHEGALYASVENSVDAGRVYRWSATGAAWEQVSLDGFGSPNNEMVLTLASFDGSLYAGTYNGIERPKVFCYTGVGTNWDNVSPPDADFEIANIAIDAMTVYSDHLYIGTQNESGGEIWRYDGATWEPVTTDGFGSPNNDSVWSLQAFDGYLYAGLQNPAEGSEVWRSQSGASGDWTQVNQNGFGRNMVNDATNAGVRALTVWNGRLYAGTYNWASGGEVWRTANGAAQEDWEQVNTDGFGQGQNRIASALWSFGDHLYAGTFNDTFGTEIWRTGLPGLSRGRFAQVVNASLRTGEATTITMSGALDWSHQAPTRGLYALPLPVSGVYDVSCSCGQDLSIHLDTQHLLYLPLAIR